MASDSISVEQRHKITAADTETLCSAELASGSHGQCWSSAIAKLLLTLIDDFQHPADVLE